MSDQHDDVQAEAPKSKPTKKSSTGRPRGRPPKRDEFLVSSEVRRTLLAILDEQMEIRTPTGTRKVSKFRAVMENLVANAAKGNPTSLNHLMRLMLPALQDRMDAHPQVWIAEYLRRESELPDPNRMADYKDARSHMNSAKDKY